MEWGKLSAYVTWPTVAVVVAAVFFAGFLIWKLRPTLSLPRISRAARRRRAGPQDIAGVKAHIGLLREEARRAKTRRERATALAQAASLAATLPEGMTSALGLYLRAMRTDPTFGDAIRGVSELL